MVGIIKSSVSYKCGKCPFETTDLKVFEEHECPLKRKGGG